MIGGRQCLNTCLRPHFQTRSIAQGASPTFPRIVALHVSCIQHRVDKITKNSCATEVKYLVGCFPDDEVFPRATTTTEDDEASPPPRGPGRSL